MKKLLMIALLFLIFPLFVSAKTDYVITNHLIDSEIEIAGGLKVKELIVVKGTTNHITRTVNYKSFDGTWDSKTIDLDNGSIYNGQNISEVKVSAFKVDGSIDFSTFSDDITDYFSVLDLENPQDDAYTVTENDDGSNTYNIFYPVDDETVAFYIEYVVGNVVVVHNDVDEINYTFKNIDIGAENTLIRVLIPYQTQSDLYNVWVHGPQDGTVQKLETDDGYEAGIFCQFTNLNRTVNFRMTLPLEQVGISLYLNHSNIDALSEIKTIEDKKLSNTNLSNKMILIIKYIIIGLCGLYVLGSVILFKWRMKSLFIGYLVLGAILTAFNYSFKFNIIYLYFILLVPIIIWLIGMIKFKKKNEQEKSKPKRKLKEKKKKS